MKITRTKADLMAELIETKRELAQVKRELENVSADRAKLSTQVRNLTAEKQQNDYRWRNAGATISALKHQRAAGLQALARILADLAATPEQQDRYVTVIPSAPKDEAPF